MAVLAAYIAALCDHFDVLAPGERATLPILSASLWQAGKALQYLDGVFSTVPALKALVVGQTADTISLSNGVDIECRPASFRTIRGVTAVGVIADEVAFWRADETSRNPDREILDAVRPALATTGGPLIVISSPYAQRGELWNTFRRDYGPTGDPLILVAKAASRTMNPTLPARVVERAYERDPTAARAEYDAEFRTDVAAFLDLAVVEAAVDHGVTVRRPVRGVRYRSGCDPSGGARDSFTLAIAHDEDGVAILDCLFEIKAPFNPTAGIVDMAGVLKAYGLTRTVGDKYAAEWVVDAFAKAGIRYQQSNRERSAIYLDVLPKFTSGRARILDNPRLVTQFAGGPTAGDNAYECCSHKWTQPDVGPHRSQPTSRNAISSRSDRNRAEHAHLGSRRARRPAADPIAARLSGTRLLLAQGDDAFGRRRVLRRGA